MRRRTWRRCLRRGRLPGSKALGRAPEGCSERLAFQRLPSERAAQTLGYRNPELQRREEPGHGAATFQ
ncbi:hypothetical protein NDU88_001112 [Pleurodeles waltl]|uniref:Uncharacterized protein n=1 Tax=Pleurodeles waltl TaxID=8319 RepID=A0AAV7U7J9_PLEWA|nr:hypothetical protein NDU88_001112 [Pleurodeles waltl]